MVKIELPPTRELNLQKSKILQKVGKSTEKVLQKGTPWRDKSEGWEHLGCFMHPLCALVGARLACVVQNGAPEPTNGA